LFELGNLRYVAYTRKSVSDFIDLRAVLGHVSPFRDRSFIALNCFNADSAVSTHLAIFCFVAACSAPTLFRGDVLGFFSFSNVFKPLRLIHGV
jgi:hypothetical protein